MFKISFLKAFKTEYLFAVMGLLGIFSQILMPQEVLALLGAADQKNPLLKEADFAQANLMPISQNSALLASYNPESPQMVLPILSSIVRSESRTADLGGQRWVIVTAYSSTVDQCDASPFITARGTLVRDGIVACNFLAFGTQVMFPELYPGKVFVVEDRMAKRNSHKIDIWFPTRWEAQQFGVKYTPVVVLD